MGQDYTVQQGDCMSSIACTRGFTWTSIWNHPKNSDLKTKRQDPNILYQGDTVYIPDLNTRNVSAATEKRHKFKRKQTPAKLCLKLFQTESKDNIETTDSTIDPSQYSVAEFKPNSATQNPSANVPFNLTIGGKLIKSQTDRNGYIKAPIPADAKTGRLVLNPGKPNEETHDLQFGTMDPIEEDDGIKKRLNNLGFPCGNDPGMTPQFESALCAFQEMAGLSITGKIDDPTRDELKKLHGS